ncbi:caspase family protein [Alphaproteobacteria bacterium]|nr:caspase family protein [Alphaproteobacteria bacterium]
MMTRFVLTLLVGLVVSLGTSAAFAETFECKRYTDDSHGFTTYRVFESWFPKRISLDIYGWKSRSGSKALTKEEKDRKYRLLPNGKMIAGLKPNPGYKTVDNVRYKCDRTSLQLTAGLEKKSGDTSVDSSPKFASINDETICNYGTYKTGTLGNYYTKWVITRSHQQYVKEAKRRGLTCGVGETSSSTQTASAPKVEPKLLDFRWDKYPTMFMRFDASANSIILAEDDWRSFQNVRDSLDYGSSKMKYAMGYFDITNNCQDHEPQITYIETVGQKTTYDDIAAIEIKNVKFPHPQKDKHLALFLRGISDSSWVCVYRSDSSINHQRYAKFYKSLNEKSDVQTASSSNSQQSKASTSAALTAAEREAERLRQRVAALEAEKDKQQQTISSDSKLPTITIASVNTKGKQGIVRGRVKDNTGIAEVTVDGTVVPIASNGNFEYSTFVPSGGLSLKVQATDLAGLTSMMSVTLERNAGTATAAINFDRLNPMGKRVKTNKDALALIVGVADYENTPAKAIFADSDAMMFRDYASEKLGIPESRIKTLVNDGADERELLLSVKSWLARASKQGKSDVYVFFAGHGLASDNGEKMYLLPYDGSPELLDDTAILRDRLFSDIASANPRSVTVFLDTCYSGTTRGTDMLIASRPIAIKALEQSIPDNFTVMTAARGDQTAKPLEEAKHGMFSYFLMKGMEGEADKNQDNKITAGELHQYVQSNVVQQSSGSQTPELQGDAERVLVRFQ